MALEQEREEEETIEAPTEGLDDQGNYTLRVDEEDDDAGDEGAGVDPATLDKRGRRSYVRTLKAEKDALEQRLEQMGRELAEVRGMASRPVQQYQPPQQQVDPIKQRLTEIHRQKLAIGQRLSDPKQQVDVDKLTAEYDELDNERIALVARQAAPQQREQPDHAVLVMQAEYPEMYSDPALYHEANAEMARLIRANGGRHGGLPMMKKAAEAVYKRNGIRQPRPAPSPGVQAKYTSTPARAGASGGSAGTITLQPVERRAALAFYENHPAAAKWTDAQKMAAWVKNVRDKPE